MSVQDRVILIYNMHTELFENFSLVKSFTVSFILFILCDPMQPMRSDESYFLFWQCVTKEADECDVEPVLRKRRPPQSLNSHSTSGTTAATPDSHYHAIYFDSLIL